MQGENLVAEMAFRVDAHGVLPRLVGPRRGCGAPCRSHRRDFSTAFRVGRRRIDLGDVAETQGPFAHQVVVTRVTRQCLVHHLECTVGPAELAHGAGAFEGLATEVAGADAPRGRLAQLNVAARA